MAATAPTLPGVRFEVRAPATEVSPLRTDIAGFIGPTWRGPVAKAVRVEGWRQYQELFGELTENADTPYAVRGYFENGGEVAYIIRLLGSAYGCAAAIWEVGKIVANQWDQSAPAAGGFEGARYTVVATSPGTWANGMSVKFEYRLRGPSRQPEVDIEVRPTRGAAEYLVGLPVATLVGAVAARSRLIRLEIETPAPVAMVGQVGPLAKVWLPVTTLSDGIETAAGHDHYADAVELLAAEREVALMAAPDLHAIPGTEQQRGHVLGLLVALAEERHDRQVIADVPTDRGDTADILAWLQRQREGLDEVFPRSLAFYHPRLRVPDPLGGIVAPLRDISPVGHVAGVISRLDRARGAHHTPANAALYEAVDLVRQYDPEEQGALAMGGINPLLCTPGQGLVVWGGRTAFDPKLGNSGLFIAHRRLIHRLIRAIRRVAEPLAFDVNGPDLWLILARAITSVLLEAWQAGALKGEIPEQAFLVRCDNSTNPPESEDLGQVLCEVYVAPAVPMEFITLRIAVSREGRLEAIET
jgi:phage tail sheath protein FI